MWQIGTRDSALDSVLNARAVRSWFLSSQVMASACLFLAGKVDETPKPLRDVISVSYILKHKSEGTPEELADKIAEKVQLRCHPTLTSLPAAAARCWDSITVAATHEQRCVPEDCLVGCLGIPVGLPVPYRHSDTMRRAQQETFEAEKDSLLAAERRLLNAIGFEVRRALVQSLASGKSTLAARRLKITPGGPAGPSLARSSACGTPTSTLSMSSRA